MKTIFNVLINTSGIVDSGGVVVFEKLLDELSISPFCQYYIVHSMGDNLYCLINKYITYSNIHFIVTPNKGLLYRFYYENFVFRRVISSKDIQLIYNFSGSCQFFIGIPQLVKVHNLLFYSKKLDFSYQYQAQFFLWIKQIFFKRLVFRFMLNKSKYVEIQSKHVRSHLSNFLNVRKKIFYVKSDINVFNDAFHTPRRYNFSKKIKFLYIVGPHFEYLNKNFLDFTNAMLSLNKNEVYFEINITLTNEQLNNSKIWDASLNSKTNFLGYINNQEKMTELFCDNTILISTSIIETLGLHVIEGIKNGVITIAPDEDYSNAVYGKNMFKYKLFNKNTLANTIMTVINYKESHSENILSIQDDLRQSEMSKFSSILDVFDEVINVQK